MKQQKTSTANVLEVRNGFRLVYRTEHAPTYCVERDTGNGWELIDGHGTEGAARAQFEVFAPPISTQDTGGGTVPTNPK